MNSNNNINKDYFDVGNTAISSNKIDLGFNNTSIFTGYLKQLLHDFNLPKFKVYTKYDQKYFNLMHEEHPEILQTVSNNSSCLYYMPYIKDGYIQQYIDGKWVANSKNDRAKSKQYFYGAKYLNYTKNLNITNNIYDSYTHEYLGEYLRFIRDYNNINLMPMYNCFSNRSCDKLYYNIVSKCIQYVQLSTEELQQLISIDDYVNKFIFDNVEHRYIKVTENNKNSLKIIPYDTATARVQTIAYTEVPANGTKIMFNSADPNYKIYMLPVKLFKSYTIAIESDSTVELCCGLYGAYQDARDKFNIIPAITYQRYTELHFSQPKLYTKLFNLNSSVINSNLLTEIAQNEPDLKLFIKLPAHNKSTIVVLEGDYLNWNDEIAHITSGGKMTKVKNKNIINIDEYDNDTKLIAPLHLLRFNTHTQRPFANRLVEFLSDNAITSQEDISDNVKRVQKVLFLNTNQNNYVPADPGLWDSNINVLIYDYLSSNPNLTVFDTYHDITGFIDKDVERQYCGILPNKTTVSIMNYDLYEEDK